MKFEPAASKAHPADEITRREYLSALGLVAATGALAGEPQTASAAAAPPTSEPASSEPAGTVAVALTINGRAQRFDLDPRVTLLDLLRERMDLTGTRKGCDHGQCGACTVLANGRRINSCLSLAVSHEGENITTVEGLARGGDLHPVQSAFIEHDGFQCGYCTPGQICSAVALLDEVKRGDVSFVTPDVRRTAVPLNDEEIRERMSGNVCRCGAYPGIVAAVRAVAQSGGAL